MGSEDVGLVESNTWLHGSAKLTALLKTDAALTLPLYDKGSASLLSLSGTLGGDGALELGLDLAGVDTDVVSSPGAVVTAGAATTVELTTNSHKDGARNGPPRMLVSRGIDKVSLLRGMVVTR